jgi:SAM-dependent methyltransferase
MGVMASRYTANNAADYERLMGRWSRGLAATFLEFLDIAPQARVIDVGCGTGSLAWALTGRAAAASVVGIDLSPAFIGFAASRREGEPGPAFAVADAQRLPIADAACDAALSLLALNFVGQPERAVAEMARVVRPGGTVGAAVWDFTGGLVYQRLFWDTAAALDAKADLARARHYGHRLTRPGALGRAFAESGLTGIAEASLTMRMEFQCFRDYWEPIAEAQGPLGDYVRSTEPGLLERIAAGVRAAYLSGAEDGPRSLVASAFAAKALKSP